ncbi:MAG: SMP-30/gluconolactonase/LRE family protein [Pseudomonadota bacterium]
MVLAPVYQPFDILGEVPIWCVRRNRLIWTDVRACRMHVWDPATGTDETFLTPDWIGAFALTDGDALLLASRKSLLLHDVASGCSRTLAVFEADMPVNRSNDGRCDRQGRFWIGTLNNHERIPTGQLYRYSRGALARVRSDIIVPNALAWSPDGATMYFADSWAGHIWAYDYDRGTGEMSGERVFLDKDALPGIPDGATVDANGCLWNARYGAGQVARITPSGEVDQILEVPTRNLTAVALGGSDMRDLFVTSARQRMSEAELAADPHAGSLFHARVTTPGLPEPTFNAAA